MIDAYGTNAVVRVPCMKLFFKMNFCTKTSFVSSFTKVFTPLFTKVARLGTPSFITQQQTLHTLTHSHSHTLTHSHTHAHAHAHTHTHTHSHIHYITTPIFYVNGEPHLGHLYTALLADCHKRWHIIHGRKTMLLSGTDEHGSKVQEAAHRAGYENDYLAYCTRMSEKFRTLFRRANVQYDVWMRTSDKKHEKAVRKMWTQLQETGYIALGEHTGWYSKTDECFVTENQLSTTEEGTRVVAETGQAVEWVSEKNYKFALAQMNDSVIEWLNTGTVWPKNREKEVYDHVKTNKDALSVSRPTERVQWAIRVPGDHTQSIYVWMDALTNYLTGVGYPDVDIEKSIWPAECHIVGKDILRFHAYYWPAFLSAAKLPLPKRIVAHGHWTVDGRKMSKSFGNVVDPNQLLDRFGVDSCRLFILWHGRIESDCNYSDELLLKCTNGMADTVGNMLSRSMALLEDKKMPPLGTIMVDDQKLIDRLNSLRDEVDLAFAQFSAADAMDSIMDVGRDLNAYFDRQKPWVLRKSDIQRMHTVIHICLEALRILGILIQPIVPDSADQLLSRLAVHPEQRLFKHAQFGRDAGIQLSQNAGVLFRKINIEHALSETSKVKNKAKL